MQWGLAGEKHRRGGRGDFAFGGGEAGGDGYEAIGYGVIQSYHKDREPPVVAMHDRDRTLSSFRPTFCKLD